MPITVNVLGRGPVTFPDGMSKAAMEAALRQLPPVPDAVAPEGPGVLSTIANNFKSPVRSALELAGRPGEALQGLVAGTLQGGVGEGLRRGFAAATEADLVNSKIEESTSKTLLENNILADSPKMRAALGLVGDIVTDPTNLLGGAGFIRRGAMTGAKALGAEAKTARALVGLPIADAFASKVLAPTGKAITQGVAKFGPESLATNAKLKLLVDPVTGLNAQEMRRLAEGKNRAIKESVVKEILSGDDAMFKGIEMADRKMISYATEYPLSKQAQDVAADPTLAAVQAKFANKFGDLYKSDVANELMDATTNIGLTLRCSGSSTPSTPRNWQSWNALSRTRKAPSKWSRAFRWPTPNWKILRARSPRRRLGRKMA